MDVAHTHLFDQIPFSDTETARGRLRDIDRTFTDVPIWNDVQPAILQALRDAAHPDQALLNLERFVHNTPDRAELASYLRDNPRAVEILLQLFSRSQFLTEIVLGNPNYLERLTQHKRLADLKSVQQLHVEAQGVLLGLRDEAAQLNALRRFQRWELLRIGLCDFFGLLDLRRVTTQLSLLAGSLIQACLLRAFEETDCPADGFAVLAMGKLGGEELNYSSDIDLIFLTESHAGNQWRAGQKLIRSLTSSTADGFLYRVDMRLRPWGRSGELITTTEGYLAYLAQHAQLWEKQALLKARVVAGDYRVGRQFLQQAEPYIFGSAPEAVRDSVRGMKQKIEDELNRKGRTWGEVKLGQGSIRDIEFVVQYLQLVEGKANPAVRSFNTLDALVRLADTGHLHADEFRVLTDGYVVLRTIEHALQLMHNKQVHELPTDSAELSYLARRLDFASEQHFLETYQHHCEAVRAVYDRYLGSRDKVKSQREDQQSDSSGPPPTVKRHLARMASSYSETFSDDDIAHHAELVERVSDTTPVVVEAKPVENPLGQTAHDAATPDSATTAPSAPSHEWSVTIVGYDYLGELSIICGLLLVYGCNIVNGQVFTYEPAPDDRPTSGATARGAVRRRPGPRRPASGSPANPTGATSGTDAADSSVASPATDAAVPRATGDSRQKIVDVFTVRSSTETLSAELWKDYSRDLDELIRFVQAGQATEAQGRLAKRVGSRLSAKMGQLPVSTVDYPIDLTIDNERSDKYTLLTIRSQDTVGFLYELTNALALNGINIVRVEVQSISGSVFDTLFVTDARGQKIHDPQKLRELRVATVLIKRFTRLLPSSSNPEAALLHFRDFVAQLFTRPGWPDEVVSLEKPEVLNALAQLLGVSDFLWKDFLRMQHENLFPVVADVQALAKARTRHALHKELAELLASVTGSEAKRQVLNEFKDREMFRVDMRHILGQIPVFWEFSTELTDVSEVVVEAAVRLCRDDLERQYGSPRRADGSLSALVVCALGKCGGRELGFASDIELMFVYEGDGKTAGHEVINSVEFFIKLVEGVTRTILARREGIFEIDLRLRPYGRAGRLAVSFESFCEYFRPDGPAWPFERQALVKLRPLFGDESLAERIVAERDRCTYTGEPFDVAAMRGMRERQIRQLVKPGTFHAKLSLGGLVDAEYLVQGLQITHGRQNPALRSPNSFDALVALAGAGIISQDDYRALTNAYIFLRKLIDALRVVRGNAKELTIPPVGSEESAFLARRLGYVDRTDAGADEPYEDSPTAALPDIPNAPPTGLDLSSEAQFRNELQAHVQKVQELSGRLLNASP